MKSRRSSFFLISGYILTLIGVASFTYQYFSADARITKRAGIIESSVIEGDYTVAGTEAPPSVTVKMVTRMAVDEVQDMIWPFLFLMHGTSFLLIHARSRSNRKEAEQDADGDAEPSA